MIKKDVKKTITALSILLSIISLNCERDLSSSYTYGPDRSITILTPAGGEVYTNDETVTVTWQSKNLEGNLRIELIRDGESVFAVDSIPDSGNYFLRIPGEIIPSKRYQLRLALMNSPDIFAVTPVFFEIAPSIDGEWTYSSLELDSGLEIRMRLNRFFDNAFLGNAYFHLRYFANGELVNYEAADTVGGTFSFPEISFKLRETDNKEFHFTGEMIAGSRISGRITGFVDSAYGSIDDSITFVRQ